MAFSKAQQFVMDDDILHIVANYCKALCYPGRVLIVRWLASEGPKSAGEISRFIALSRATTSYHLACLEKVGLITGFERGPHVTYVFNETALPAMKFFLDTLFDEVEAGVQSRR